MITQFFQNGSLHQNNMAWRAVGVNCLLLRQNRFVVHTGSERINGEDQGYHIPSQ